MSLFSFLLLAIYLPIQGADSTLHKPALVQIQKNHGLCSKLKVAAFAGTVVAAALLYRAWNTAAPISLPITLHENTQRSREVSPVEQRGDMSAEPMTRVSAENSGSPQNPASKPPTTSALTEQSNLPLQPRMSNTPNLFLLVAMLRYLQPYTCHAPYITQPMNFYIPINQTDNLNIQIYKQLNNVYINIYSPNTATRFIISPTDVGQSMEQILQLTPQHIRQLVDANAPSTTNEPTTIELMTDSDPEDSSLNSVTPTPETILPKIPIPKVSVPIQPPLLDDLARLQETAQAGEEHTQTRRHWYSLITHTIVRLIKRHTSNRTDALPLTDFEGIEIV